MLKPALCVLCQTQKLYILATSKHCLMTESILNKNNIQYTTPVKAHVSLTFLWLPAEASKNHLLTSPNLPSNLQNSTFSTNFLDYITTSLAQVSFSFPFLLLLFFFYCLVFYWGWWKFWSDYTCGFGFELNNFTRGVVKFVSFHFLLLIVTVSCIIQCQFQNM